MTNILWEKWFTARNIVVVLTLIAACNVGLLFLGGRTNVTRVLPQSPVTMIATDLVLISIGIFVQNRLRAHSKSPFLRLVIFALTVAVSLALGLLLLELILVRFHPL